MHKKAFQTCMIAFATVLLISTSAVSPGSAFIYPDGTTDAKYESFGPRADRLEFRMYPSEAAMWGGLAVGQIDLTDWPLDAATYAGFVGNPDINIVGAGGETGYHVIAFNCNPNSNLGNPPTGPPNPMYDSVNGIPPISSNVFFRRGVAYLLSRPGLNAFIGASGTPILTPVPSYMGPWIWPGATGYGPYVPPPNPFANAEWANAGILRTGGITGPRYWDLNGDTVAQPGELSACNLVVIWDGTDANINSAFLQVTADLVAEGFTLVPPSGPYPNSALKAIVGFGHTFHITSWSYYNIGPDADYLYDYYNYNNYYYDPGCDCPNFIAINDAILDSFSGSPGIKADTTFAAAITDAYWFQMRFEAICPQIPMFSYNQYKASRMWYSGGNGETIVTPDDGENNYRRVGGVSGGAKQAWLDLCDENGIGSNSWFSLLNAYPTNFPYGTNGAMTIRYGWSDPMFPVYLSPLYKESSWDAMLSSAIYETLGYRDPYTWAWRGNLVENWTVGTWLDGVTIKSKVKLTLRPDAKWHDGNLITVADVIFSIAEAGPLLVSRGYQPPWWWPTGALVKSYKLLDPYTVEILYDLESIWAESWTLGGFYIIPKHVWMTIILSGNPSAFCPDPNLIGSGPWRYTAHVPGVAIMMLANKPGSTVTTDIPGAVPIMSPGYHDYCPVHVNVHADGYNARFINGTLVTTTVTLENRWLGGTLTVDKGITFSWPNGTVTSIGPILGIPIAPGSSDVETFLFTWPKCRTRIDVSAVVTSLGPWFGQTITATLYVWGTIREDITGTTLYDVMGLPTYPYKSEAPAPDCIVDLRDVMAAALAFGSKPGSHKWNNIAGIADINNDYKIDLKDFFAIAKKFNWR